MKSTVYLSVLGLGALLFSGCSPSNTAQNVAGDSPTQLNSVTENAAILPSTTSTPTPSARATLLSMVWVPGNDDKLHLRPVSKAALDAQKKFGDPTAALAEIVRMAPRYFPPKTRVLDFHDDGKTASVNLNRNFEDANFWSKAGEKTTQLAMYALVNSASRAVSGTKPIVLETEKRPLQQLGELDAEGAIEPKPSLQAPLALQAPLTSPSDSATTSAKTGAPKKNAPETNTTPSADFSAPSSSGTGTSSGARTSLTPASGKTGGA